MDELRKASILLRHLSAAEREQILGQFDPQQREQLERLIGEASEVSHDELAGIVSEYQSWLQRVSVKSNTEAESSSSAPIEPDESSTTDSDRLWRSLSKDAESIVDRLIGEPATVLAAVLCQLHESTAREVYASLSEERQAGVVSRLPAQRELRPMVKQELARFLSESAGSERNNQRGTALLARLVGP
jgi:flagellar motor switch protein FliG